jgi:hypothetical protein
LLALAVEGNNQGLWLLDSQGQSRRHMTIEDGLSDEVISVLFEDHHKGLWIGTENGIDRIAVASPLSYFDERNNLKGKITDIVRHNSHLYVATSSGLFKLTMSQHRAVFVDLFDGKPFTERNCFKWLTTKQGLLATCNTAIYHVDGDALNRVDHSAFTGLNLMAPIPPGPDDAVESQVLTGHDKGLGLLRFEGGRWRYSPLAASEIGGATIALAVAGPQRIWLQNTTNSVNLVEFPTGLMSPPSIQTFDHRDGLPKSFRGFASVQGSVVFFGKDGLYRFDSASRRFVEHKRSVKWFGEDVEVLNDTDNYLSMIESTNTNNASGAGSGVKLLIAQKQPDGEYIWYDKEYEWFSNYHPSFVFTEGNGVSWVLARRKLWRYDLLLRQSQAQVEPLLPHADIFSKAGKDFQVLPATDDIKVEYDRSLLFQFASPVFESRSDRKFQYKLLGFDEHWSDWSDQDNKEYTNLFEGQGNRIKHGTITEAGIFHPSQQSVS